MTPEAENNLRIEIGHVLFIDAKPGISCFRATPARVTPASARAGHEEPDKLTENQLSGILGA